MTVLLHTFRQMVDARQHLIEGAARRYIPEPVTKRIAQVIHGTAVAFVSTSPGDPHSWRLFITDTHDRITWWDGEETG